MSVLIDTSVLLAYAFSRDVNHDKASEAIQSLKLTTPLVPVPVLTELFYMTSVRVHYRRAIEIFSYTRLAFNVISLTNSDMIRMQEIMQQYEEAELDLTDTAMMAIAERLNITQIYTFDHRDFSIFRPKHCNYLELLP